MSETRSGQGQRALVTGASSGIGAAFAARLARDGYDLVLVARRRERLDDLAAQLGADTGAATEVLEADLTDAAGVRAVETRLAVGDVDMLVNNAGFGAYHSVAEGDPDEMTEMIALNVVALTRLTHAALPAMLARGRGAIINLSSGTTFALMPTRATYTGTKAYVNAFTQILHEEVKDQGVRVQALVAGITRTPFHERSGTDLSRVPPAWVMEPEALVDASLAGLALGEVVCIPGLPEAADYERFEAARAVVARDFLHAQPAARYR